MLSEDVLGAGRKCCVIHQQLEDEYGGRIDHHGTRYVSFSKSFYPMTYVSNKVIMTGHGLELGRTYPNGDATKQHGLKRD